MQCSTFTPSSTITASPLLEPIDRRALEDPMEGVKEEATLSYRFCTGFTGYMEMYADRETVANYLNAHEGWFCRCAQPMTVVPMEENGYVLTVGHFSSFGYEVEPKMAVILEPPQDGLYVMHSVPIPNEPMLGYEVDYQATMNLVEVPMESAGAGIEKVFRKQSAHPSLPEKITRVQWQLQMEIIVQFPKFIHCLPPSLVQKTGDRLLVEIVRQVSPRLTYKVQQDFHEGLALPLPPKTSRHLQRLS